MDGASRTVVVTGASGGIGDFGAHGEFDDRAHEHGLGG